VSGGSNTPNIFHHAPQNLRYAPGLCDTATRSVRWIAIEDLRNLPNSIISNVLPQLREPRVGPQPNVRIVSMHFHIGGDKRPQQPRPDYALVVGSVAARLVAGIATVTLGVGGCQCSQTIRSQQMLFHHFHNQSCPLGGENHVRQTYGKDLICPDAYIRCSIVDDIVQVSPLFIPNQMG
jgi:hypothetical protein